MVCFCFGVDYLGDQAESYWLATHDTVRLATVGLCTVDLFEVECCAGPEAVLGTMCLLSEGLTQQTTHGTCSSPRCVQLLDCSRPLDPKLMFYVYAAAATCAVSGYMM
jgi:hypothetical protein